MLIICLDPLSLRTDLYLKHTCLGPGEGNMQKPVEDHHSPTCKWRVGVHSCSHWIRFDEHRRSLGIPPGPTQSRTLLLRELSAAPPPSDLGCIHMFMSSHVDVPWLLSLSV